MGKSGDGERYTQMICPCLSWVARGRENSRGGRGYELVEWSGAVEGTKRVSPLRE